MVSTCPLISKSSYLFTKNLWGLFGMHIIIIIIIIIILLIWKFSILGLADGFPLESEWQKVFSSP